MLAARREKNPMFGQNHSDDTKQIMSDNNKGENNPMFGSNLSNETRKKISPSPHLGG